VRLVMTKLPAPWETQIMELELKSSTTLGLPTTFSGHLHAAAPIFGGQSGIEPYGTSFKKH